MTDIADCFSHRISEARTKFLAACDAAYIPVQAVAGRATGSEDDRRTIYADLARFGSPSADRLLIMAPAEGGNSAFVSAGLMTALVQEKLYRFLPRDVALVVIHAINPKGPLWPGPEVPSTDQEQDWQSDVLANAEARYQSHPGPKPFSRKQLAELPMSSVIQPAWDTEALERICHLSQGESTDFRLLELTDMPGIPGQAILATTAPDDWPGFDDDALSSEITASPLLAGFQSLEACENSSHAQLRMALHEGYQPPSDKNKDRFMPERQIGWHAPLWSSARDYLTRLIETLAD